MEITTMKLSNGNEITYKIVNGTAYHIDTNDQIIRVLENARNSNSRIRVFYGYEENGTDWLEEYDTMGTISRSCGTIKIPLIIKNKNSSGGAGLSDNRIIKITIDKKTVYQTPNYHIGTIEIKEATKELKEEGYNTRVYIDNKNVANFKDITRAEQYIKFIKGDSNKH